MAQTLAATPNGSHDTRSITPFTELGGVDRGRKAAWHIDSAPNISEAIGSINSTISSNRGPNFESVSANQGFPARHPRNIVCTPTIIKAISPVALTVLRG
jgi:hypothetical protein